MVTPFSAADWMKTSAQSDDSSDVTNHRSNFAHETGCNDHMSVLLDPESDLDLTGNGSKKSLLSGTIHPFQKSHTTVLGQLDKELKSLLLKKDVRLAAILILLNLSVAAILSSWSSSTNSLALRAYNYITMFELLCLLTYIVSAWARSQDQRSNNRGCYTLGFERMEVLAVFSTVVTAQLGCIFLIKESVERLIDQPEIHAGRLLPGALLALLFHISSNYCIVNHAFTSICRVASSSWMQEHVADVTKGLCGVAPALEAFLLPRVNPFFLISFSAGCGVLLVDMLLQIDSYYIADTLVGLCIAVITIGTMWPIASCSGRVLLHTTPSHALGQLDKLLSEARTLDGVLEIKSEKFYTLSMGLRERHNGSFRLTLAGSLQVRVRRDADEQMVLAHVTNRLSPLVLLLTVQVLKDGWSSRSVPLSGKLPLQCSPMLGFSKTTYVSGFNKPAAAVAPYLQTPPRKSIDPCDTTSSPDKCIPEIEPFGQEPRNDFSFSTPSRAAQANTVLKPRQLNTDIARMYKAAGFKNVSLASGRVHIQGSSYLDPKTVPTSSSSVGEAHAAPSFSISKLILTGSPPKH